jgi:hypothetical protein
MTNDPVVLPLGDEGNEGATRCGQPFWAQCIFALDDWLRRRQGVFEYSHKLDCIFRVQLGTLHNQVMLSDGTLGRPGDRLIDMHFWNERMPVATDQSLAWACRVKRCFVESLYELARYLTNESKLADVNIIRANINLDSLCRMAVRYGFEGIPDPVRFSPSEWVHQFGEDILYWLLTLACNSSRLRSNKFWRRRQLTYLSRTTLERKYIARLKPRSGARQ